MSEADIAIAAASGAVVVGAIDQILALNPRIKPNNLVQLILKILRGLFNGPKPQR
jgi:hypothetical protein